MATNVLNFKNVSVEKATLDVLPLEDIAQGITFHSFNLFLD